jgi:hypothetical protein
VLDVSHQEGAIEVDAARGEQRQVGEETGMHVLNFQWFDTPILGDQIQAVETIAFGGFGVAECSLFEERRCFV